jgi:hypothetical protein
LAKSPVSQRTHSNANIPSPYIGAFAVSFIGVFPYKDLRKVTLGLDAHSPSRHHRRAQAAKDGDHVPPFLQAPDLAFRPSSLVLALKGIQKPASGKLKGIQRY